MMQRLLRLLATVAAMSLLPMMVATAPAHAGGVNPCGTPGMRSCDNLGGGDLGGTGKAIAPGQQVPAPAPMAGKRVVKKQTRVSFGRVGGPVVVGERVVFRGKVKRGGKRVLVLQRQKGNGKWGKVRRKKGQKGKYRFQVRVQESGKYRVRVRRKVVNKPKRRVVFRAAKSRTRMVRVQPVGLTPERQPEPAPAPAGT